MTTTTATRADVCAIAVAECFRGDGEILANPIGTIPMVGGRLARAVFEPDLCMTDGEAALIANDSAYELSADEKIYEYSNPYRSMFDWVWSGRRHVMMGATQVDQYGNQNIAAIGDYAQPRTQLLGYRGAPGNTINDTTSYWVPNHSPQVVCAKVDTVCGIGYDRAAALLGDAGRFHEIRRVVTNLCVIDFETPDHRARLRSVHPGVTVEEVQAATGFELVVPDDIGESRLPNDDELRLLYTVIDPEGRRAKERSPVITMHPALHTRLCDLLGVQYPIVQTGMGYVAGARLTTATSAAGAFGVLASATMSFDELSRAIGEVKSRTDKPFGVNLRADQTDATDRIDLMVKQGVRVASFAQAPSEALIKRCKDGGLVVIPSIGAKRHAEKVAGWGVDAVIVQGGEGGGHTGSVPTSLLLPQVVDTVDIPVIAAGGYFDGRGLVAALAYGAAGIAMGTRFLLTSDSTVPDAVKQVYLSKAVTDTMVTTQVDGVPHRVLRTEFTNELDQTNAVTSLPRALRNAVAFKGISGESWLAIVREGIAMKRNQELTWSQVVMQANTPMLLRKAMVEGRPDLGVMASGQVVGVIDDLPSCAEVVNRVMAEADATLARLAI